MRIPRGFNPRSPQSRRDLASSLRTRAAERGLSPSAPRRRDSRADGGDDAEIIRLRAAIRDHPCHRCPDREDHARWAERFFRLQRDTRGLQRRVEGRTNTIARTFDRVCALLETLGYLSADAVTDEGRRLGRLYTELDLLTAECLRAGHWEELSPPELAAVVSALVYESRQPDEVGPPRLPGGAARDALASMVKLWAELDALEKENRLEFLREPDLGFAWAAHQWASGKGLDDVLTDSDLSAGDFVRWTRQLIDLLGQIADAAGVADRTSPIADRARAAVDALRRGVVAYSSVG
jgi:ATP-dependent RNA helicase HelY